MSGEAVPYRLRPNKAVDRRLFMELLNRCQRWIELGDHAYVSMAAASMEDQKLVHRLLGIKRLLAFDMMKAVVERQKFNAPIASCVCLELTAADLTADLPYHVDAAGFDDAEGYIVWLDYTDPKSIVQQLREFEKLAGQLGQGDIVRVTVNANYNWWAGPERDGRGSPLSVSARQARALARLESELGSYMPLGIQAKDLGPAGIADALSRAFGRAASNAVPALGGLVFEPLSITRYADGQQMLSMTGMIATLAERQAMRDKVGVDAWSFGSKNWSDVKHIAVADLTTRERQFLEMRIGKTAAQIKAEIKFDFDAVTGMPGFLANFREHYRFYPALNAVEL